MEILSTVCKSSAVHDNKASYSMPSMSIFNRLTGETMVLSTLDKDQVSTLTSPLDGDAESESCTRAFAHPLWERCKVDSPSLPLTATLKAFTFESLFR